MEEKEMVLESGGGGQAQSRTLPFIWGTSGPHLGTHLLKPDFGFKEGSRVRVEATSPSSVA